MSTLVKKNNGVNQFLSVSWSSNNHRTVDGYEMLTVEILKLAAHDYRRELAKSKKANVKTRECHNLERFFRSEYGHLLSMGKSEYIMEKIQKEMEGK